MIHETRGTINRQNNVTKESERRSIILQAKGTTKRGVLFCVIANHDPLRLFIIDVEIVGIYKCQ